MAEGEDASVLEVVHRDAEDDHGRDVEARNMTALPVTWGLTAFVYDAVAGRRTSSSVN